MLSKVRTRKSPSVSRLSERLIAVVLGPFEKLCKAINPCLAELKAHLDPSIDLDCDEWKPDGIDWQDENLPRVLDINLRGVVGYNLYLRLDPESIEVKPAPDGLPESLEKAGGTLSSLGWIVDYNTCSNTVKTEFIVAYKQFDEVQACLRVDID